MVHLAFWLTLPSEAVTEEAGALGIGWGTRSHTHIGRGAGRVSGETKSLKSSRVTPQRGQEWAQVKASPWLFLWNGVPLPAEDPTLQHNALWPRELRDTPSPRQNVRSQRGRGRYEAADPAPCWAHPSPKVPLP